MALLETFGILFESNAKKVADDTAKASDALDDIEGTAEKADKTVQELDSSFLEFSKNLLATVATFKLVEQGLDLILTQASRADEIGRFTDVLGINVEELGAWERAVEQAGGSSESLRSSVSNLNNTLTEMSLTGGADSAETFARLGINAFKANGQLKTSFELLPEIASSFERLTDAEAVNLGQKLGLDTSTILLLQQGRNAVDEVIGRQKQLATITEEDTEVARAFAAEWTGVKQGFTALVQDVTTAVLPTFTIFADRLSNLIDFVRENKEVLGLIFAPLIAALAVMKAPLLVISTILAFILDDFLAWFEDTPSVIGSMIGSWTNFKEVIQGLVQPIKDLIDWVGQLIEKMEIPGFKAISRFFGLGGDDTTGEAQTALQRSESLANVASVITSTSKSVNQTNSVSVSEVNVDARGGDSAEISANISDALKSQMEQVVATYDDGVLA